MANQSPQKVSLWFFVFAVAIVAAGIQIIALMVWANWTASA